MAGFYPGHCSPYIWARKAGNPLGILFRFEAVKHKVLFLFLFGFGLSFLQAQRDTRYHLGAFYAQPLGNFAVSEGLGGLYAEPGWGLAFDAEFPTPILGNRLSFTFSLSYQRNQLDNLALGQDLTAFLNDGRQVLVSSEGYHPLVFTIGPRINQPLFGGFHLVLEGGLGVLFSNLDPMQLTVLAANGSLLQEEFLFFNSQGAFAYRLNLELGWDFSERSRLSLFAHYAEGQEEISPTLDPFGGYRPGQSEVVQFINTGLKYSFALR